MKQKTSIAVLKVLSLDDDRLQLDLIRRMYLHNNIKCDCCTTVHELVQLLRKNKYNLILTDMRMPEINGNEVLTFLRHSNLRQSKTIPVLVVTARIDLSIDDFRKLGFEGCLYKPFSEEELISTTISCIKDFTSPFIPNLSIIIEGERDQKELLDIFIEDNTDRIKVLWEAFNTKDYGKISEVIHKCAPLWEILQIGVPVEVLEKIASLPANKWDEVSLRAAKILVEAMEQAVRMAKKLREELL